MPAVVTTCKKCNYQFNWNTDYQEMPDCPNCGHNPKHRYQRADVPALIKMLKSQPALIKMLKGHDRCASSNAAAELGKRGDRRAVEPLIAALQNDDAKLAAVIALGKLGDERALQPLKRIKQQGGGTSESAAEAIQKIERGKLARTAQATAGGCPHGHGPLKIWDGKPRCWTCGWPDKK